MVEKIFYQSSLPRCGSTLLQNILAQNPDIYSSPTSGLCDLLINAKSNYTNAIEFKAQDGKIMDNGFKGFCKGGLYGFYNNITDRKYVVDKCRGWSVTYDFINWFDPNPKVIIMIRDLRSIVSSLEKKFRENQHLDVGLQNWNDMKGTTVDKRIDMYLSVAPPLCAPIDIIYDIIVRRIAQKCLFIKFEDFSMNPEQEVKNIYNYLEIPYYQHDFNNIPQFTKENDVFYRPFGDHLIRNKIEPVPEDYVSILGKHNCNYITNKYNWFYKAFNYNVSTTTD
jgi:sulfotransferase